MTGPGKLMCQKIIHLKARSSASGWSEALLKGLREVDNLGLNSVALPALGTGLSVFDKLNILLLTTFYYFLIYTCVIHRSMYKQLCKESGLVFEYRVKGNLVQLKYNY